MLQLFINFPSNFMTKDSKDEQCYLTHKALSISSLYALYQAKFPNSSYRLREREEIETDEIPCFASASLSHIIY